MSDLAICYVGDLNFLLSSLISIRAMRRFVSLAQAEVFVFYLDPSEAVVERLGPTLETYAAKLIGLDLKARLQLEGKHWNETHVPNSTLGRFFFEAHLPPHIERILYIDGDTLVVGDVTALIEFSPPHGKLLAADDISFFARHDWGRYGQETRKYFAGLGLARDAGYLNAGLLMAQRETWRAVAGEALTYFQNNSEKCRYHDQSALNATVGARRLIMSPKWNFQTPFRFWGVDAAIEPRIFHFTEFPKPWMGDIQPWLNVSEEMQDGRETFASLDLPEQRLPPERIAVYNRRHRDLARRLSLMPLRLWRRRDEITRLARNAAI